MGGHRSDFILVPSGVPQGSILGPLLYVAYLYDIKDCFKHAKFLLYADDKKIYFKVQDQNDCVKLQEDLDRLSHYYKANRIGINVDKCLHVSFTRRCEPLIFTYSLNGVIIKKVNLVKDLGVLLDSKLTFSAHIDYAVNKALRNLGFINRITKPFTDTACVKMLYFAYVRSVLEYCCCVWNPQYAIYELAVERVQRKFVRQLNYRCGINTGEYAGWCQQHSLRPLRARRVVCDMMLLHSACSGALDCAPLVERLLRLRAPPTRTRHTQLFYVPFNRTNYAANSVLHRLPRTYIQQKVSRCRSVRTISK